MKKRVLFVHNFYKLAGGEDIAFTAEKDLLRSKGHEVFEYTDNNGRLDQLSSINAAVQTIWSEPSRRSFSQVLRTTRPDIVHFHNTFLAISPSVYSACRKEGIPVVQTLHNFRLFCPSAIFYRDGRVCEDCMHKFVPYPGIIHKCYRNSLAQTSVVAGMLVFHRLRKTWLTEVDRFIALSSFSRHKFIEGGLPQEKITIKPNFIDPDPGERDSVGDFALFVGRLSAEKGIDQLIDAWQQTPDIPLKIIGDGPLSDNIRTAVSSRELAGIELLGRQPRSIVFEMMKRARFLIFPSECYENIPMTILEAFASGLPVIAPAFGVAQEIVEHDKTGLHYDVGNPLQLAQKVRWAWDHPERISQMGFAARREFLEKYTVDVNYQLLVNIYNQAIG